MVFKSQKKEMFDKKFLQITIFVFFSLIKKLLFLYEFSRIIKSNKDISA